MAWLDVVDVILDPDFIDTVGLSYTRAAQTVGDDGMAVNSDVTLPLAGVVTNHNGDILRRRSVGEHVEGSIIVHTLTRLTAGSAPDVPADVVTWQGARYTVAVLDNWSHFGHGFVAAQCDLIPLAGAPA